MGELIGKLIAWLFKKDQPSSSTTYGNPDLHPIDTDRLAKGLNVEREAEQFGKQNVPRTEDTTPTSTETKIIQRIEKARQEYADWGSYRARFLNETITNTDISSTASLALQLDAEFERKSGAELDEWTSTLSRMRTEIQQREREHTEFKDTHGLTRTPKSPSHGESVLRHTLLVVFVVVEGGLNSVFFAQGMWGGFLDGVFYALMFAFLNIFLAYCYGRLILPQLFHQKLRNNILGGVALAISLAAIVAVALVIAHYRDAVSGGSYDLAAALAWQTVRATPFQLRDVQSVLLCVISVAFALAAMYDTLGLNDPYPGYGAVSERREQALADYDYEIGHVRDRLDEKRAATLKQLDSLIDAMQVALLQLDQAISQKAETGQKLTNAFANVNNCHDALLSLFRTHNKMHRTTNDPEYFSQKVRLRPIATPDFNVVADRAKYVALRAKLQEVEAAAPRIRANIQSSYTRFYDRLKPLDDHFTNTGAHPQ